MRAAVREVVTLADLGRPEPEPPPAPPPFWTDPGFWLWGDWDIAAAIDRDRRGGWRYVRVRA